MLDRYNIEPKPHVVELDEHPLGDKLQALLADMTGRRTVPNILVIGKSIGGGDQMQELDESGTMIKTLKSLGGTRITSVKRSSPQTEVRRRRRT